MKNKSISSEQRFGVILEQLDTKLDQVLEGNQALDAKTEKHYKNFLEFSDFANYKFGVVLDELHVIRNELKEKIGRDEFTILEKRVSALERRK